MNDALEEDVDEIENQSQPSNKENSTSPIPSTPNRKRLAKMNNP